MAQFHRIKWLHEREGWSERKIATALGVSRNTVRKYLSTVDSPTTMTRQKSYGHRTYSDEVQRVLPLIDEWLKNDQTVWKKQKHTAVRIHARLVKEYGFTGSASNIRAIVARRKKRLKEVFIPLQFQLGHQFQFDWGEADVILQGKTRRVYLFCIQLSASRKRFVRAYLHERQEAFLDGFVQTFNYLGGVPSEGLFDNLKSAVVKILAGRERVEQETFQALQAHYLFKAEFCNVRSGNEKGQVEGLVGYTRRNALVPIPDVQSLSELNEHLIAWCEQSEQSDRVPHTDETVSDVWGREKQVLHPLPLQAFEACRLRSVTVSKTSTVTFETNQYSVPSYYAGRRLWLKAFVDHISVVDQNQIIAKHTRCNERDQLILVLDHYLDVLLRKPRAVRDAAAMHATNIPEEVREFHREMQRRHGADGDRAFIRFLLLHREVGMDTIQSVLATAVTAEVYHFEGLHDLLLKRTGQIASMGTLSADQVPVDLALYRVQKTDVGRVQCIDERWWRSMTTELLLSHYLKQLRLLSIARHYKAMARDAEEKNLGYEEYLLALLEQESHTREESSRQQRLKRAAFPTQKTLDAFEFHLMPSLSKTKILTLSKGEFIEKHENVLLIGNSGTGKSHIATALGVELIQQGYKIRFVTAHALVENLLQAKEEHRLMNFERQWLKYDAVICDELGYVPFTKMGAELLFQFFSTRHERGSLIVTSNLDFGDWIQLFGDEKMTAALLDRLTHRAHILLMNGDSYRFRQTLMQQRQESES